MATSKSQLDREIAASLAVRGRNKPQTYTVQPRNLWRTWNFSTLPAAIAFGLSLNEPFDVSTDSGAIVWGWAQRPHFEAEVWGEKHRQRHHATKPVSAAKKYSPSDAVRSVLRRSVSSYDSPREIDFDLSLIRRALDKCGPGNEILADALLEKIRELAMGAVKMRAAARVGLPPTGHATKRRGNTHY